MAGLGYGLRGLASGFQTGIGLGLERKRMDMLEEEQKRQEKLIKDQEEAKMTWYNNNEELLKNFDTQPQDVRNSLIFESVNFEEYWHKYLVDSEKAKKAGDFEELKHLNDIAEEKIKLEAKMIEMGITAENGAFGEMYTEKKMDYIKKLKMGALTNKPIGTAMFEERFGELPEEKITPSVAQKKYDWATEAYQKGLRKEPGGINFEEYKKYIGVSITPEKSTGLKKKIEDIVIQGEKAGIPQDQIDTAIKNEILGITTPSAKSDWDWASEIMFGSSDWVTGISKPGIVSMTISQKLHQGQPLTEEEKTEVRNNYNMIKGTFSEKVAVTKIVESQLKRYGISLEAPVVPEVTPEVTPQPSLLQRGVDKVKSVIGAGPDIQPIWGLEGQPTGEVPKEAPPVKVPTGAKEAQIPLMSEKELEEAIRGLDPMDPMYKLIYDEAVKRGYIKK